MIEAVGLTVSKISRRQ